MLFNTTAKTSDRLRDVGRGWNRIGDRLDGAAYYDATIPVIYSAEFYSERLDWMRAREQLLVPLFCEKDFQARMRRLVISSDYHDCSAHVKEINCPTLVVACEDDTLLPRPEQDFIASQIKDSQYVVIPHCGHASMYEKPMLFASLILGFVNVKDTEYKI